MIEIVSLRDGVEITPSCTEEVKMDKWLKKWAEEAIEIEKIREH